MTTVARQFTIVIFVFFLMPNWLQAQFVWLRLDRSGDHSQATLFFSKYGDEPSGKLPAAVATTKVTMRTADSQPEEIVLSPIESNDKKVLAKSLQVSDDESRCLETSCRFGLRHGYMRHDYAKAVDFAGKCSDGDSNVHFAKDHRLDIVPSFCNGKITIAVDWDGVPRRHAEVFVIYPNLRQAKEGTGVDRSFVINAKPGLYSFRTHRSDRFAGGEFDGKAYNGMGYVATLTVNVSEEMVTETSD
jgi:hypothetical protein